MNKRNKNRNNNHKARQNHPQTLAPSPAPAQAATSPSTTSPKKSKVAYLFAIPVALLIVILAIPWLFKPTFVKSRQWKQDIGDKTPGFYIGPYWDQSENVIRISHNGEIIGTTITSVPDWITDGIEMAENGQSNEQALFAARYATECLFVENDFDYLHVAINEPFDRDQHWRYCVWTLGEAYFNRPETMSDEVYDFIRPILVDLLR